MEYEIVNLEEKIVVGLGDRTNNLDPKIGETIGNIWANFCKKEIYDNIKNKSNQKTLGIYTDYDGNEKDDYTMFAACEVTSAEDIPPKTASKTIPAGKYAKFILKGNVPEIIFEFWENLWNMYLDRAFTYDFEEYQHVDNNSITPENDEVHVYIALK
jgi:Uncharacterized protein conserved in bacteria